MSSAAFRAAARRNLGVSPRAEPVPYHFIRGREIGRGGKGRRHERTKAKANEAAFSPGQPRPPPAAGGSSYTAGNTAPPPAHLSDAAKVEWELLGNELLGLGLVTAVDTGVLAVYCQAFARWAAAEEKLKELSLVIPTPGGFLVQSPYLAIANKAIEQMMKASVEFGMTPSSRTRVSVAKTSGATDPLAEFIDGDR